MKMTSIKTTVFAAAFACASFAFAQDATAVVQMARDVKKPTFTQSVVQMDLIDKNGKVEESRIVTEYGRDKNDLSSVVMIFNTPASVKDTRFLQIENKDADDDKWIYLPSLKSTRRIAASEGSKSFMGTDATYDDMSTRETNEDNHEFVNENEEKNGYKCWVVKSTPKDPKSSQYMYRITWIDKDTKYVIYSEMYDKKGKLLKTLTLEGGIAKETGVTGITYDIPRTEYMKNVQTGHSTRLKIQKLQLDKEIPDRVFTSAFLNTGK